MAAHLRKRKPAIHIYIYITIMQKGQILRMCYLALLTYVKVYLIPHSLELIFNYIFHYLSKNVAAHHLNWKPVQYIDGMQI